MSRFPLEHRRLRAFSLDSQHVPRQQNLDFAGVDTGQIYAHDDVMFPFENVGAGDPGPSRKAHADRVERALPLRGNHVDPAGDDVAKPVGGIFMSRFWGWGHGNAPWMAIDS